MGREEEVGDGGRWRGKGIQESKSSWEYELCEEWEK